MRLERIDIYKAELASVPTSKWGEVLFRLATESAASDRSESTRDVHEAKKENHLLQMRLSLALPALKFYANPSNYAEVKSNSEMSREAVIALDKIDKVNWLMTI